MAGPRVFRNPAGREFAFPQRRSSGHIRSPTDLLRGVDAPELRRPATDAWSDCRPALRRRTPKAPLDLVLITGDVTDAGRSAEWAEFKGVLATRNWRSARGWRPNG